MDFKLYTDSEIVMLYEDLKELYSNGREGKFFLGDGTKAVQASNAVQLSDDRLVQVLGELLVEAHNELCDRFVKKLAAPPGVEK